MFLLNQCRPTVYNVHNNQGMAIVVLHCIAMYGCLMCSLHPWGMIHLVQYAAVVGIGFEVLQCVWSWHISGAFVDWLYFINIAYKLPNNVNDDWTSRMIACLPPPPSLGCSMKPSCFIDAGFQKMDFFSFWSSCTLQLAYVWCYCAFSSVSMCSWLAVLFRKVLSEGTVPTQTLPNSRCICTWEEFSLAVFFPSFKWSVQVSCLSVGNFNL